jgi:ribonuclease E
LKKWKKIESKYNSMENPGLVEKEEPMEIKTVRDIFTDRFSALIVSGDDVWENVDRYLADFAPKLRPLLAKWENKSVDVFDKYQIGEQIHKSLNRVVYLKSGGSLVIDRTEAMTVIDVNTGKFTGIGGSLEETVTRNNLEAAEEIVRQMRLRDIGGIVIVDFIDMLLEENRNLVLRRVIECLVRDRSMHSITEVTSLGLIQITRKRVGQGLVETFSDKCPHCSGAGYIIDKNRFEEIFPNVTIDSKHKRIGSYAEKSKDKPAPAPRGKKYSDEQESSSADDLDNSDSVDMDSSDDDTESEKLQNSGQEQEQETKVEQDTEDADEVYENDDTEDAQENDDNDGERQETPSVKLDEHVKKSINDVFAAALAKKSNDDNKN